MGYTTYFNGTLQFNRKIDDGLKVYINEFADARQMKRDNNKIMELCPDWESMCYNGKLGENGEYFIGGSNYSDPSILEINYPPKTQPGLWCNWIINDDGELEWNGAEKFYDYERWLIYLIENFFNPNGYVLNGVIEFEGEDRDDFGNIVVVDNEVTMEYGIHSMDLGELSDDELIKECQRRGFKVS